MKKPTPAHVIAFVLFAASQVLAYVKADPALAVQLHLTQQALLYISVAIAFASRELFGTATPPDPATVDAAKKAGAILLVVGFAQVVAACTPKTEADLLKLDDCVTGQLEQGVDDPVAIAGICAPGAEQLVKDVVAGAKARGVKAKTAPAPAVSK